MKLSRTTRHWLAVLPSFLMVAALAARAEWRLSVGREVHLEVGGYDPMDPLAGRYVVVTLAVTRVDTALAYGATFEAGDPVWVALEPGDPWWTPTALEMAAPTDGRVALRGRVTYAGSDALFVDYDLDRFYIPDDGIDPTLVLERPPLTAVVRIDAAGVGGLADLLVDGEPYAAWNARQAR